MNFWKLYDKYMYHTTALAIIVAFGLNLPHIIWLDWLVFSGTQMFTIHSELDVTMVLIEHIEILPLAKIAFDVWRKIGKRN